MTHTNPSLFSMPLEGSTVHFERSSYCEDAVAKRRRDQAAQLAASFQAGLRGKADEKAWDMIWASLTAEQRANYEAGARAIAPKCSSKGTVLFLAKKAAAIETGWKPAAAG